jgi:ELWxxDGT repeat protein
MSKHPFMKPYFFLVASGLLFHSFLPAQVNMIKENSPLIGGLQIGNKVIFATTVGQLGFSDGTAGGTAYISTGKVLLDFNHSANVEMNGKFYFAGINASAGSELWVTDGTDAGTYLVKDIKPGPAGSNLSVPNERGICPVVNNILYFLADDGVNGSQLWKSDGTEAGTQMVKVIRNGGLNEVGFPSISDSNFHVGDNFYFIANDGTHGLELWKTRGTSATTQLVADLNPGPGSTQFGPSCLSLCGVLVFMANNGQTGMELWRTAGSAENTFLLKDIAPGPNSSLNDDNDQLNSLTFKNRIYFTAFEGGAQNYENEQMWVTDGTPAGTKRVTNSNYMNGGFHAALANNGSHAAIKGGQFYFIVNNYENIQTSLWASNGTTAGTYMVKPINEVEPEWGPDYRTPVARILMPVIGFSESEITQTLFRGTSFFMVADDGIHKRQLWISDGTNNGTVMLSINPVGHGVDSSQDMRDFYYFYTAGYLYFSGIDTAHGEELWRSNGTQGGTGLVYDVLPGQASSGIGFLGVANGVNLVFSGSDGAKQNIYSLGEGVRDFASWFPVYLCPGSSIPLVSDVAGSTYQWQVRIDGVFTDLTEGGNFSGTQSPTLQLINMPSMFYGVIFRCLVNGSLVSRGFELRFNAFWLGSVNNAWENPDNWYCGKLPDENTDVLIQCSFNPPLLSSDASCRTLTLLNQQSLQIASGFNLNVTRK